jgi:predicted transcriptional regulator
MSIRLDPDVREAIEELAELDERSVSSYINRALRQHVEDKRREKKR